MCPQVGRGGWQPTRKVQNGEKAVPHGRMLSKNGIPLLSPPVTLKPPVICG